MLVFVELTELIARKVGVKPGRIVLGKFANQETQVQLTDNVRGQDVYVIQVRLHPLLKHVPVFLLFIHFF